MHIFCRNFLIILQLCRKICLLWKSPYKKRKKFSVFYNDFLCSSAGGLNCYMQIVFQSNDQSSYEYPD